MAAETLHLAGGGFLEAAPREQSGEGIGGGAGLEFDQGLTQDVFAGLVVGEVHEAGDQEPVRRLDLDAQVTLTGGAAKQALHCILVPLAALEGAEPGGPVGRWAEAIAGGHLTEPVGQRRAREDTRAEKGGKPPVGLKQPAIVGCGHGHGHRQVLDDRAGVGARGHDCSSWGVGRRDCTASPSPRGKYHVV